MLCADRALRGATSEDGVEDREGLIICEFFKAWSAGFKGSVSETGGITVLAIIYFYN